MSQRPTPIGQSSPTPALAAASPPTAPKSLSPGHLLTQAGQCWINFTAERVDRGPPPHRHTYQWLHLIVSPASVDSSGARSRSFHTQLQSVSK